MYQERCEFGLAAVPHAIFERRFMTETDASDTQELASYSSRPAGRLWLKVLALWLLGFRLGVIASLWVCGLLYDKSRY
jgi:hypothetical protein